MKKINNQGALARLGKQIELSDFESKVLIGNSAEHGSADTEAPFVVLKYFQMGHECFSDWTTQELKQLSAFNHKLSQMTWRQVLQTSGKGQNKTGVAYTPYDVATVKHGGAKQCLQSVQNLISLDIRFFELRVDQKMRVHGFRAKSAFFLVLLDREHAVFA